MVRRAARRATAPPFEHGHSYVAPTRVHGRASFGAFVDKKSVCTLEEGGRPCLVQPSVTYDEAARARERLNIVARPLAKECAECFCHV